MKLTIYYDGLCQLCSREMQYVYNVEGATDRIAFVDFTDPAFDTRAEGLDPVALERYIHVRLPDGAVRTGVDAFIELWKRIPGHAWLARVVGNPVVKPLAKLGYLAFAGVRRHLPRRRASCPLQYRKPVQGRPGRP